MRACSASVCVATALWLVACSTPPPAPRVELPALPAAFKRAPADGAVAAAGAAWWQAYADPVLDDLVSRALRNNTRIEDAAARLAQARALVSASHAATGVQGGLGFTAGRQSGPLINAAGSSGTLLTLGGSLSYEVDLFGRMARTTDAAALDAQSREALLQSARLMVQADVAQTYLALRMLDAERALAQAAAQAADEALALATQRRQRGAIAEPELQKSRGEAAASHIEALQLERRRAELEQVLALLLGEPAWSLSPDEAAALPALPQIPAGLPSEMLARRPDVAAAQRAWQATQLRSGQARDAWWPSLVLNASGGRASDRAAELLRASAQVFGLGAVLALPLLDGGRREAGIAQADAESQAAWAAYRAQVLAAFKEVEDQLSALHWLAEEAGQRALAANAAQRTMAHAESRWRSGLASRFEWLAARRGDLQSRRLTLQVQAAQAQAAVGLVRALGGGWGPTASAS